MNMSVCVCITDVYIFYIRLYISILYSFLNIQPFFAHIYLTSIFNQHYLRTRSRLTIRIKIDSIRKQRTLNVIISSNDTDHFVITNEANVTSRIF